MKKIPAIVSALLLAICSQSAYAQIHSFNTLKPVRSGWGAVGGMTISNVNAPDWESTTMIRGRGGFAYKFGFEHGFAIQPQLVFNEKSIRLYKLTSSIKSEKMSVENGYIEIPVQIQWGPELEKGRPYVFVEPFIGFGINGYAGIVRDKRYNDWKGCNMSRFESGVGFGLGFEIWHCQLSAGYSLNFGGLARDASKTSDSDALVKTMSTVLGKRNFGEFYITLGFFL